MAIRMRPKAPLLYQDTKYVGVNDSIDGSVPSPDKAFLMRNVYPLHPAQTVGGGVIGRPGFKVMGAAGTVVQRVHQFTKLDGTEITMKVDGGTIWTYNWGTDTWTEVVSAANLATATITLNATGLVYAVTYTNKVVISDGTNTPFTWDGTAGAGGLTSLTNAPVFYGQPVVYYAKLFGIKNSERSTIVWSEENDPTIGYEAGGYNNAWTLGQTAQAPLYALAATDEALFYFRAFSTGAIWGAANDDFRTTGVHEAVSQSEGTISPDAVLVLNNQVWWVSARGRPHRFIIGAGLDTQMWRDASETVKDLPLNQLGKAQVAYNASVTIVHIAVAQAGATVPNQLLNFSAESGQFLGYWDGFDANTLDVVKNATGEPLLAHGQLDGNTHWHGTPQGDQWEDELQAGAVPITHVLETGHLGYDTMFSKVWDRVDIDFRVESSVSEVTLTTQTSRDQTIQILRNTTGASSLWDVAKWDVDVWASADVGVHVSVGTDINGRWARYQFHHSKAAERFGFLALTATAYADDLSTEGA